MCRNRNKAWLYFIYLGWWPHSKAWWNNWQLLWCSKIFQSINATKALSNVLGKQGMFIKSCYASMEKYHITRYQELQNFKAAQKGVIQDYSEKIKALISFLKNNLSDIIKSTIHLSSKSTTSSNDTNVSEMSSFSSESNITTEISSISNPNGSLIFGINGNYQNQLLPTRPVLLFP